MAKQQAQAATILKRNGPLESQALADSLENGGGASNAASARKLIERARRSGQIESTYPVRFDKSYLYYLPEHRRRQYPDCVRQLLHSKPAFHRVFKTILANKGWITLGQIGKASGCLPVGFKSKAGGRQTLDKVTEHLLSLGLIVEVGGEHGLFRIGTEFGSTSLKRSAFRKRIELESKLLHIFRDWIRNCFLVGYDSHTVRADDVSATEFNQTLCDMHGPAYFGPFATAKPLKRSSAGKNFLVAEILGFRQFSVNDAEATLERVRSVAFRWKSISVCPVVLAPWYSKEAWNRLRRFGVIALTFRDVFGQNIEELLKRFWSALGAEEATPESLDDIEKSLELSSGTAFSEGFVGNITGTLFELIIALGFRANGYDTTLQKVVRMLNEKYEVDVVAVRGPMCKLIECKGRHADCEESREDVERHFENRCRAAADPLGWDVTERHDDVEAIYITSGKFSSEAASYAKSHTKSHGISCSVMDRIELLQFLKDAGQPRLVEIIKRYYGKSRSKTS